MHRVTVASDGEEALRHLERENFDLVFMDVQMPKLDGLETTRRYREKERGSRTPIVALTAHSRREDRVRCLEAGMDSYFSKPIRASDLLEKESISAEVVDPRTTWPLDEKTLIESAKKTSRVIVLDEGYGRYGVTAELAAVIAEGAFYDLDAPVKRMGAMHVPIPFSPPLEDVTVPTEQTVSEAARLLCNKT